MRAIEHTKAFKRDYRRDYYIRSDPLLIYRKMGSDVQQLIRLGSHSEIRF